MASAITCDVVLTSASTRSDGSLGLRLATPELSPMEKAAIFGLQGKPLKMLLQPEGETPGELVTVAKELDFKPPSVRLRGVLFIWHKQAPEPKPPFDQWYIEKMEAIIQHVKGKLNPE